MAEVTYRANLSARSFPFVSDNWGRTIIVPQYDNTFNRTITSSSDSDQDVGIPQIFYCHNVMPNAQGFQSVGYQEVLTGVTGASNFVDIFLLRDAGDVKVYLGVTATGQFYINSGTGWVLKGTYPANKLITTAYVSGNTYIYIDTYGCLRYDFGAGTFVSVTLTGLSTSNVAGIVSSTGYLIAWSKPIAAVTATFTTTLDSDILTGASTAGIALYQAISGANIQDASYVTEIISATDIKISKTATASGTASYTFAELAASLGWSSTLDPTDFVPSLATGAGGGALEAAKGAITFCADHALGFIAYTTSNAVAAIFSNNFRFPFNFKEIVSAGGVASPDLVAIEGDTGNHYAYTSAGFQSISTARAQTVLPELTDFIAGELFEDFDGATNTFIQIPLTSTMRKKVNVISQRYVVMSYGISSLTHALVYDIAQKRFGKLKQPHVATIQYELPAAAVTEIPKQSLGLLQSDGSLKVVDFAAYSTDSYGVIALGKYQFIRSRLLTLDEIQVENVMNQNTFECLVFYALDGKNTQTYIPTTLDSTGKLRVYGSRVSAINHSLIFKGSFQMNSLVLAFHTDGGR